MDDLLSNNIDIDEEINIILSQQDNVQETVGNTLTQKYAEEIKLYFDEQIVDMKFYMEKSLNELKKIHGRICQYDFNKGYVRYSRVL